MSVEVRCGCGKLVYASAEQAGQNLQCPYCKGVVPVPVAMASSSQPKPADPRGEAALSIIAIVGLVAAAGFFGIVLEGPFAKFLAGGCVLAIITLLNGKRH